MLMLIGKSRTTMPLFFPLMPASLRVVEQGGTVIKAVVVGTRVASMQQT